MAQNKQPTQCVIIALDHENGDINAIEFPSKAEALRWRSAENQNQKNIMVNLVETHPPELEVDCDT